MQTATGIVAFDSGTQGGQTWSGTITTVDSYYDKSSDAPYAVELVTNNRRSTWYLSFNDSSVTITKVKRGGEVTNMGQIGKGKTATISNWNQSGLALVVKVTEIALGHASIDITFGP